MMVCCGEALIDFTPGADGGFTPHPGGSPYNVAVGLARQDVPVAFLSAVSQDLFGARLMAHLEDNGVDTRWTLRSERPTTLAFVDLPSGEEPQYAFYANGAADVMLTLEELPSDLPARLHHFGSISLMQEPAASAWEAYAGRVSSGSLLSLDPNIRPALIRNRAAYLERFWRLLEFTAILKLSRLDLGWLLPDEPLAGAAARLLAAGTQVVVVTCGDQGARLFTRQGEGFQPAFRVEEADSIGAGDSFMAGFLAELSRHGFPLSDGAALGRSLRWAAASAALNCRRPGAQPPTGREVAAFLATQPPSPAALTDLDTHP